MRAIHKILECCMNLEDAFNKNLGQIETFSK